MVLEIFHLVLKVLYKKRYPSVADLGSGYNDISGVPKSDIFK